MYYVSEGNVQENLKKDLRRREGFEMEMYIASDTANTDK